MLNRFFGSKYFVFFFFSKLSSALAHTSCLILSTLLPQMLLHANLPKFPKFQHWKFQFHGTMKQYKKHTNNFIQNMMLVINGWGFLFAIRIVSQSLSKPQELAVSTVWNLYSGLWTLTSLVGEEKSGSPFLPINKKKTSSFCSLNNRCEEKFINFEFSFILL